MSADPPSKPRPGFWVSVCIAKLYKIYLISNFPSHFYTIWNCFLGNINLLFSPVWNYQYTNQLPKIPTFLFMIFPLCIFKRFYFVKLNGYLLIQFFVVRHYWGWGEGIWFNPERKLREIIKNLLPTQEGSYNVNNT